MAAMAVHGPAGGEALASDSGARGALAVQRVPSPAGIDAYLAESRALPIVVLKFAFLGAGSSGDPADRRGLANMTAELLDQGAASLDAEAFGTRLAVMGASLELSADRDSLTGTLEVAREHLEAALELLRSALVEPRFDADAVARVRTRLLSTLARLRASPQYVSRQAWWAHAFPDHPYARPVLGTESDLARIAEADLRAFATTRLDRARLVVGVAGAVGADELAPLLERVFGTLPAETVTLPPERPRPASTGEIRVERLPFPQSAVTFGQPGIARDSPDFYPALVLNELLGGRGLTSKLFLELREKRGLVYSIGTRLENHLAADLLVGSFATGNRTVAAALDLVREIWRRLAAGDIDESEVNEAKTHLKGAFILNLDGTAPTAAVLLLMQRHRLGIDYLERRNALIDAVTVDDVRRVAATLLDPDALGFTVAGDPPAREGTGGAGGAAPE